MSEKRKKYDREFREGAVRIVEETGKPTYGAINGVSAEKFAPPGRWATREPRACLPRSLVT